MNELPGHAICKLARRSQSASRETETGTWRAGGVRRGRGWDKADRRGHALVQANSVRIVKADAKFVSDIKTRVAPVEKAWVERAKAKGLPDPAKVLAQVRSGIAKAAK